MQNNNKNKQNKQKLFIQFCDEYEQEYNFAPDITFISDADKYKWFLKGINTGAAGNNEKIF